MGVIYCVGVALMTFLYVRGGGGVGWIYSIAFCSLFVLSVLRVYPSATGPGHLLPPESLFPLVVAR